MLKIFINSLNKNGGKLKNTKNIFKNLRQTMQVLI